MIQFEYIKDIIVKNKLAIFAFLFGVASLIGSAFYVHMNKCNDVCTNTNVTEALALNDNSNDGTEVVEVTSIKVDVKGAVKKPGVYELSNGSTIMDAIATAGGVSSKGTTSNINLSKKVSDEMVIYVFTKDELKKRESANEVVCEIPKCECETIDVSTCPSNVNGNNSDSSNQSSSNNQTTVSNGKVSLNKGTVADFMTLDGIGESKAQAIIEYRNANGPFEKIEDITKVSGIGESTFEKIKDKLTL